MIDVGNMKLKIADTLEEMGIPYTVESPTEIEPLPIAEKLMETTELRCEIDNETLKALLSLNPSNNYTIGYTTETNIPNRKNKRKRIHKKWIKKYGFKLKTVVMDGFRMNKTSDGDICTYEAVREI